MDKSGDQREWLEGEYPVWHALPTPSIDWSAAEGALAALGLPAPSVERDDECGEARLLRSLPLAYSRGTFGTVRDVLCEARIVDQLQQAAGGAPLTSFPTAGFAPVDSDPQGHVGYTVLRTAFGVIGDTVVSVRLPDTQCPTRPDSDEPAPRPALVDAGVLTRFLPQGRTPSGREVAEAVGMHQATSARAVAAEIRRRLEEQEERAAELNTEKEPKDEEDEERERSEEEASKQVRTEGKSSQQELKEEVEQAVKRIDELADIAHQLDRNLSTILRRFSGELPDAPPGARELVPPETRRRYEFALDNIHILQEGCRLGAQAVRHELVVYEQSQRERFQFVAAVLASIVLIPTLIASVFGVNLGVPGEGSGPGFVAFLAAMIGLGFVGYSALDKADDQHWHAPLSEFRWQIAWAGTILVALVAVLLWVS